MHGNTLTVTVPPGAAEGGPGQAFVVSDVPPAPQFAEIRLADDLLHAPGAEPVPPDKKGAGAQSIFQYTRAVCHIEPDSFNILHDPERKESGTVATLKYKLADADIARVVGKGIKVEYWTGKPYYSSTRNVFWAPIVSR